MLAMNDSNIKMGKLYFVTNLLNLGENIQGRALFKTKGVIK